MKQFCISVSHAMTSGVARMVPLSATAMIQTRGFAARKGTRERRLKLKKARKLQLQAQAAQKEASSAGHRDKTSKLQLSSRLRTSLDPTKSDQRLDDVWLAFRYRRQLHPLKEAIEMHRQILHPTVMNLPDAPLYLSLELDMTTEKKTKYLDNFSGVIRLPHFFDDGKSKSVIAFSKDETGQQEAVDGGADMVGGVPLIKRVQGGEALLADYKYIVAHPDILLDLGPLRGIMKRRFPNINRGTVSTDLKTMVEHFKKGIEYASKRDNVKQDFAWVDVQVGQLNMPTEQNVSNIEQIVKAVCSHRQPKLGEFVKVAVLTCPPSGEKIIVDVTPFLPPVPPPEEEIDEEEKAIQKQR